MERVEEQTEIRNTNESGAVACCETRGNSRTRGVFKFYPIDPERFTWLLTSPIESQV